MGPSCATRWQRSRHGSGALVVKTSSVSDAPVLFSSFCLFVLLSGQVWIFALDPQVRCPRVHSAHTRQRLAHLLPKRDPLRGAGIATATLRNAQCCLSLSPATRYLCVCVGGCALAVATMGGYSGLLLVPTVAFPLLLRRVGRSHVHAWAFGLQMLWQTLWHLVLQYKEYYLREPVCARY